MLFKDKRLLWVAAILIIALPIAIAATSPLLAWRRPVYIISGFAGILGLGILFIQPLLAQGVLPTRSVRQSRDFHFWLGLVLMLTVIVHVIGLWITSPPDMIDALLFRAPTVFSYLGVIAMWAIFLAGGLMMTRRHLALSPATLRKIHRALAVLIVTTTVAHALLIEGTMGTVSKWLVCAVALATLAKVFLDRR